MGEGARAAGDDLVGTVAEADGVGDVRPGTGGGVADRCRVRVGRRPADGQRHAQAALGDPDGRRHGPGRSVLGRDGGGHRVAARRRRGGVVVRGHRPGRGRRRGAAVAEVEAVRQGVVPRVARVDLRRGLVGGDVVPLGHSGQPGGQRVLELERAAVVVGRTGARAGPGAGDERVVRTRVAVDVGGELARSGGVGRVDERGVFRRVGVLVEDGVGLVEVVRALAGARVEGCAGAVRGAGPVVVDPVPRRVDHVVVGGDPGRRRGRVHGDLGWGDTRGARLGVERVRVDDGVLDASGGAVGEADPGAAAGGDGVTSQNEAGGTNG